MRTTRIAAILLLLAAAGCQKQAAAQPQGARMDQTFGVLNRNSDVVPKAGGRGWAALYLAAKFEKALVVLETDRAAPGAVDGPELVRDRAQAG